MRSNRVAALCLPLLTGPLLFAGVVLGQNPDAQRLTRELADIQQRLQQLRQTQATLQGDRLAYWPRLSGETVVFDPMDRGALSAKLSQQVSAGLLTQPAATELASLALELARAAREPLEIETQIAAAQEAAKRNELAVALGNVSPVPAGANTGTSPAGRAPGWSRGQQLLAITYDECLGRARSALQAESYRMDHAAGNFAAGVKEAHTAVIMCNPVGAKEVVNIVVMSNGGGGGDQRQRLQARMESATSPATAATADPTIPRPEPLTQRRPQPPPQVEALPSLGPDRDGWGFNSGTATILRFFGSTTAAYCRAECEKDANCKAFSWIKPGGYQPGDPPMCYLMSSWSGLVQHSCCVSAVRN